MIILIVTLMIEEGSYLNLHISDLWQTFTTILKMF